MNSQTLIKYVKGAVPTGFLHSCIIRPKEDESGPMFTVSSDDGTVIAHLKGYAIIPADEYAELLKLKAEAT